jgi:hypothetical protein
MRYTVVYLPAAKAQLANLWSRAVDRQAVADASDRIDLALRDDPDSKATPFRQFHVYVDHPLAVLVHIDPGDRMVRVVQVRRTSG